MVASGASDVSNAIWGSIRWKFAEIIEEIASLFFSFCAAHAVITTKKNRPTAAAADSSKAHTRFLGHLKPSQSANHPSLTRRYFLTPMKSSRTQDDEQIGQ